MCFYKDTQALLARNTLRQFFINKVADHTDQNQKVSETKTLLPPASDPLLQGQLPYKKLQISSDLFKDLVKLSHGDKDLANEHDTQEDTLNVEKTLEHHNIPNPFPDLNIKYEENSETQTEPEKMPEPNLEELIEMIENSNKMLVEIQSSQDSLLEKIQAASKETANEKEVEMEESPFEKLNRMNHPQKNAKKPSKNPTYIDMLSSFTNGRTSFPYTLRLSAKLPSPILREKNVKISVELVRTSDGTRVENHGSMLLHINLFTWELPTNPIIRNRAGNKVLQGEDECELKNGLGSFDKLQINEVTSKFINGYIAVLVVPKRPINFGTSLESLQQKKLFKIQDIKPLLVEKVIVKSKKKNQQLY